MRKTERYLPVGTVVTCVGELAPNHIRTPVSATPAGVRRSLKGCAVPHELELVQLELPLPCLTTMYIPHIKCIHVNAKGFTRARAHTPTRTHTAPLPEHSAQLSTFVLKALFTHPSSHGGPQLYPQPDNKKLHHCNVNALHNSWLLATHFLTRPGTVGPYGNHNQTAAIFATAAYKHCTIAMHLHSQHIQQHIQEAQSTAAANACTNPAGTVSPSGTHNQTATFSSAPLHLPSASSSGGSSVPESRGSSEGAAGPSSSTSSSNSGNSSGFGGYFQSGSFGGSNPSAQGGGDKSVFAGPFPGLINGQRDIRGGGGDGEESLAYVLRKPVVGPSYITTLSVDQLVAAMSNTARKCRVRQGCRGKQSLVDAHGNTSLQKCRVRQECREKQFLVVAHAVVAGALCNPPFLVAGAVLAGAACASMLCPRDAWLCLLWAG
eukprot:scaffold57155_cov22-Tisochrysis_lutea.AAC.2